MSLTTLQLEPEYFAESIPQTRELQLPLLALLAANLFVLSGGLCFGLLYFYL